MCVQLTMLGIPCIYYGSEQAFDGWEGYHDLSVEDRDGQGQITFRGRYIRESMLGGTLGAFGTSGGHFFDGTHPTYQRIAAVAKIVAGRGRAGKTLGRGRQYPREVRFDGSGYVGPRAGELVAWSRIMSTTRSSCASTRTAAKTAAPSSRSIRGFTQRVR